MDSKEMKRRIFTIGIGVLGVAVQAFADPDRCLNCGFCSGYDSACGMCQVEAVQACCSGSYGPGAYAYCNSGHWMVFCDGEGGSYVSC